MTNNSNKKSGEGNGPAKPADKAVKKPNNNGSSKPFIVLPQTNKPLKKVVVISSSTPSTNATSTTTTPAASAPVVTKTVAVNDKKVNNTNNNGAKKQQVTTSAAVSTAPAATKPAFQVPDFQKKKNQWWKTPKQPTPASGNNKQHNNKTESSSADGKGGAASMLVSPETPWFDQYPHSFAKAMKNVANSTDKKPIEERIIHEMEEAAKTAYYKEIDCYRQELAKLGISSDQKWLSSVINSGTWSDKIAALALRVQESPFHNLEAFDLLLGIALKKDMRSGFMAIEAIKDLLINNLLPEGRPLKDFTSYSQALATAEITSMQVPMLCWYESQLKTRIAQMLTVLDQGLKANITHFRHQAMDITLELLSKRQEQETQMLSLLVNKMGDSEGKVSSKACESLKTLLKRRPVLKSAVIREVRIFIYRPNTKLTAIFTAVNFLGQIQLSSETIAFSKGGQQGKKGGAAAAAAAATSKEDRALALQLAECYLSLFEKAVNAKEEGSRLLTALLNGINKVFPVLSDSDKNHSSLLPYMDQIFRLVHTAKSFATSTQALALISHMVFANNAENEKKKKESKKSNVDGKDDEEDNTISAVDEKADSVRNRYYVTLYSKLLSPQSFQHAKNTLFLNLIYKSVKYDPNLQRAKAFVKRIAICATECSPAMTAGLLFMISEIMKARPQLKKMLTETDPLPEGVEKMIEEASKSSGSDDEDDEKEKEESDEDESEKDESDEEDEEEDSDDESHKNGRTTASVATEQLQADDVLGYFHINKRNPLYAVEDKKTPSLYELSLLRHHFHPSIKAFADALCEGPQHCIAFTGDPLTEFNLIAFLNRFAYKNPKQKFAESLKTNRQNQGLGGEELPVNQLFTSGEEIDVNTIAPEKHFFYKFFGEREALRAMGKSKDRKKKRKDDEDGSDDEDDSSLDEAEMDRYADKLADDMMKHDAATRGEEFGDDDDEDDDFGDYEEMDFDEDDEDEEDDDDDSELVGKKSKKVEKNSKNKSKKDSSAVLDFEDFKKELGKKGKKNAQKASEEDDDEYDNDFGADEAGNGSDDDDVEGEFEEPEAYIDSDEDEGDEMEEIEMSDVEEIDEDDDEDGDFPIMLDDEDDDDDEEPAVTKKGGKGKDNKKNKGKKSKRSRDEDDEDFDMGGGDDGDDVFGAAEDYEEEMDKIINTFKFETPAAKIARAMKEGKSSHQSQPNNNESKLKGKNNHKGNKVGKGKDKKENFKKRKVH